MPARHFLSLDDCSRAELEALIDHAIALKAAHTSRVDRPSLRGKTLAMIFEKASTRTRVSFEAGMAQLGGHALFLAPEDTQLGRGETVEDTARVLSRMVDAIMVRNHSQTLLERFTAHATVPVINALTDRYHPCQLLADLQTWTEQRGAIAGRTVAWVGDGNNMCNSYIQAARIFAFTLHIAAPPGYRPDAALLAEAGDAVHLCDSPTAAVAHADLVVTDTWTSMGDEADRAARLQAFASYQVSEALMAQAAPDALFMHCLPAHRGEEVTDAVIDGPQSAVWDEAENRLHAQKALLEFLLNRDGLALI